MRVGLELAAAVTATCLLAGVAFWLVLLVMKAVVGVVRRTSPEPDGALSLFDADEPLEAQPATAYPAEPVWSSPRVWSGPQHRRD